MKLHTDNLTRADISDALNVTGLSARGVYVSHERGGIVEHRSRKRKLRLDFYLVAEPGYGRRWTNSGNYGVGSTKAATWLEWGAFLSELLHRDPHAIANHYDGAEDFERQTQQMSEWGDNYAGAVPINEWRMMFRPEGERTAA